MGAFQQAWQSPLSTNNNRGGNQDYLFPPIKNKFTIKRTDYFTNTFETLPFDFLIYRPGVS